MRGRVFGAYFEKLFEGDPIALAATGVFVLFLFLIAIVAVRYKMDERREAERRKNRWTKRDEQKLSHRVEQTSILVRPKRITRKQLGIRGGVQP